MSGIPTAVNLLAGDPQAVALYFARLRASGVQYPGCCERLRAIFRNAGRVEPSDAMIDAWLGEAEEGGAA